MPANSIRRCHDGDRAPAPQDGSANRYTHAIPTPGQARDVPKVRAEMPLMIAAPHATSAPLGAINAHPTANSPHRLSAPWAKDAVKQWCSAVYAELDTRLATNARRRTVAVMIDDLADLAHIYPPVYDVVEQVCLDGPSVGMHMITSATAAATMRQDWALCGLHSGYRLVGRCNMADSRQLLAGHEVSAPTTAAQPTLHPAAAAEAARPGTRRDRAPAAGSQRPQRCPEEERMLMTTFTPLAEPELPAAALIIGIGNDSRHAVTRSMAIDVIGSGRIRDAVPWALCGERVGLVPGWGAYQRGSEYLSRGDICPTCRWIVATQRDEVAAEIADLAPAADSIPALTRTLGDPLVGVRLLEAIADDENLYAPDGFRRSHRADLLALASQHLPEVLVCESCVDGDLSAHQPDQCPAEMVACMGCTATSGPWAGEWIGQVLEECTVPAPCSVLRALCQHYNIAVPDNVAAHMPPKQG